MDLQKEQSKKYLGCHDIRVSLDRIYPSGKSFSYKNGVCLFEQERVKTVIASEEFQTWKAERDRITKEKRKATKKRLRAEKALKKKTAIEQES